MDYCLAAKINKFIKKKNSGAKKYPRDPNHLTLDVLDTKAQKKHICGLTNV